MKPTRPQNKGQPTCRYGQFSGGRQALGLGLPQIDGQNQRHGAMRMGAQDADAARLDPAAKSHRANRPSADRPRRAARPGHRPPAPRHRPSFQGPASICLPPKGQGSAVRARDGRYRMRARSCLFFPVLSRRQPQIAAARPSACSPLWRNHDHKTQTLQMIALTISGCANPVHMRAFAREKPCY